MVGTTSVISKALRPRISLRNRLTYDKLSVILTSYSLNIKMLIRLDSLAVLGAASG
jgi:hypothetical protein